ncbi:hypothetical protein BRD20_01635 [Halobacteriales archaeon SW_8_65_20]|nr:MAG: hypothetical protein BRD20_01635 [Halobacteriales archaeon SW_8_65_20]
MKRQLPGGGKLLLFLSSYTPLYLIFVARLWDFDSSVFGMQFPSYDIADSSVSILALIALGFALVSTGYLLFVLWVRRTNQGQLETFVDHQNKSHLFSEYLLVYIFPLVAMEFDNFDDVFSFALFFALVGLIAIRSNRLYTNPMLVILGYSIYQVKTEHGKHLLLTDEQLEGDSVSVNTVRISNGVHIVTN